MKKRITFATAIILAVTLAGCGAAPTASSSTSSASAASTESVSTETAASSAAAETDPSNQLGTQQPEYDLDLSGTECIIPEGEESDVLLKIRQEGFRVGYANDIPYEYIDGNNDYTGFEIEILKEASKRLGISKIIPVLTTWDAYASDVQQNKMDIFGCGVYVTEERQQVMNMTNNTYNLSECMVVRKDSGIKTMDDLKDKTVEATTGQLYLNTTQDLASKGVFGKAVQGGPPEDLVLDVKAGKCDAAMMDIVMGNYLSSQENMQEVEVMENWEIQTEGKCSYVMTKSDAEFTKELDKALDSMKDDGTMAKILDPYGLGKNVVPTDEGQVEIFE